MHLARRVSPSKRFDACILGTAVVPWTADYAFDEPRFRRQVQWLLAAGYTHLYVFGTAGEGYAVTDAQFLAITRAFVDEMRAGGTEPMVGVISLSMGHVRERIRAAHDLGVRAFQVSLPSWGALDEVETAGFFDALLAEFGDSQFLHYNLQRAKRLVTADEYAAIAARHPNLVATKNTAPDMVAVRALQERAPMLQHFLGERGYLYGSLIDTCGLLISVAMTNFASGQRYFDAGQRRDTALLAELEGELAASTEALARCVSSTPRIDAAYDKVLWRLHDPEFPTRLLPPYRGADEGAAERYAEFLRTSLPRWAP